MTWIRKIFALGCLMALFLSGCTSNTELEISDKRLPWEIISAFPQNVINLEGYLGSQSIEYRYDYLSKKTHFELRYRTNAVDQPTKYDNAKSEFITLDDGSVRLLLEMNEALLLDSPQWKQMVEEYIPEQSQGNLANKSLRVNVTEGNHVYRIEYLYEGTTRSVLDYYKGKLNVQVVDSRENAYVINDGSYNVIIDKNDSSAIIEYNAQGTNVDTLKVELTHPVDVDDGSGDETPDFVVEDLSKMKSYRIVLDLEQVDTKPGEKQVYNEYIINEPFAIKVTTELFNARGEKTGTLQSVEALGRKFMKAMDKPWVEGQALRISHIQLSGLYVALSQAQTTLLKEEAVGDIPCLHYSFVYESVNQKAVTVGEIWIANLESLPKIPIKGFYEQKVSDDQGVSIDAGHVKVNFTVSDINSDEEVVLPTP